MKKVAILIPFSRTFERGLVRGITDYSRKIQRWSFCLRLPDYTKNDPNVKISELLKNWKPDGIIARLPFLDVDCLKKMGVPAVITHIYGPIEGAINIIPDCDAPMKMAAEYFLNKKYKSFGFCGFNTHWCLARCHFFRKYVSEAGFDVNVYQTPKEKMMVSWEREQDDLVRWIVDLPKPSAILTTNDDRGMHVLEACKIVGIKVPEEIAVLGSDNDELVCNMSEPPLSSISYNFERSGFEAASLLNCLMEKKIPEQRNIVIHPLRVITRQSSDLIAIKDPELAFSLSYIKDNIKNNITVEDVVTSAIVSRRSLEMKFKKLLDRTISEEIKRLKIESVSEFLTDTNLTVSQISDLTGFSEPKRLNELFFRIKNMTPTAYRKDIGKI